MTTINKDDFQPLEWCEGCDFPAELCECDRTPNRAPARTHDERTGRDANTSPTSNSTGAGHQTPPAHDRGDEPNADRTATARGIKSSTDGKGFWRARWEWLTEWGPLLPIWVLAAGLGAAGFTVSFVTVEQKMRRWFGDLAWVVPAAVDLSIIVFTLLDIFLARRNRRIPWMRYIPWVMTAATIYLNVTAYHVLEAQVAHAVLPSLWVVFSEAIARIMRERAEDEEPATRKVPLVRWVCAPVATLTLWRAMQLWKIGTYDQALELEEERQLAKAVMKDCFGSLRAAPRTLKVRYRQRKITVAEVYSAAAKSVTANVARPALAGSTTESKAHKSRSGRRSPNTDDSRQQAVRSAEAASDRQQGVRPRASNARSSKPGGAARDRSPREAGASTERLSKALAELRDEGIVDPSVRVLAARAGCSPSTAHTFKKGIGGAA